MSKQRTTKTKVVEKYDGEGVLESVEQHKILNVKVPAEHFFITYLDSIGRLYGIKNVSDRNLIDKFAELAEFNTGRVQLTTQTREDICEQLSISKPNLSKNIKRLKDAGLITGDKGSYILDPRVFWKGDAKAREEMLKSNGLSVTINFSPE